MKEQKWNFNISIRVRDIDKNVNCTTFLGLAAWIRQYVVRNYEIKQSHGDDILLRYFLKQYRTLRHSIEQVDPGHYLDSDPKKVIRYPCGLQKWVCDCDPKREGSASNTRVE